MQAKFGPAGTPASFAAAGHKSSLEAPSFIKSFGLNAFEYQCGHGVRISEKSAAALKKEAERNGITLSVHAPYYISLSSKEEEKRKNSVKYILQTATAAKNMGAERIVVHSGSVSGMTRAAALKFSAETILSALEELEKENLGGIKICPETMGKINQLGDLDEVLTLCQLSENLIPCVDFGHLNARTRGGIKGKDDYKILFDKIEKVLGFERLENMHVHFSKIEYTGGGEKRHLNFDDDKFGPPYEPFAELLAEYKLLPTVICESAGMQCEDAKNIMDIYLKTQRL